jgi:hypothetical protein
MKVVSWNVNFSERTVGEYEVFDWKHRSNFILADIKTFLKADPNVIFALQEVMPDYIADLDSVLAATHNISIKATGSPAGRRLYTAIPKTAAVSIVTIDPPQDGCRECWDIVYVAQTFCLINCHLPMDAKYRLPISTHVAKQLRGFNSIVWVGDFNTFSDSQGYEQCRLIQREGFYAATTTILAASMLDVFCPDEPARRVIETFLAYPYDVVPQNDKWYPTNLDHIFIRDGGHFTHDTPLCYDDSTSIEFNGKRYGTSDHFALYINLKY